MPNLENEFKYYIEHKVELAEKYSGKYVVIKNDCLIGVYDDLMEAVTTTAQSEPLGSFLVQLCSADQNDVMCSFHSRVSIAR